MDGLERRKIVMWWVAAEEAAAMCDVFMAVGTSAVVWPAAGFIQQAAARGATTVEVNAEETAISRVVEGLRED